MLKLLSMFLPRVCIVAILCVGFASAGNPTNIEDAKSIYEFSAKDISGKDISMDKYKGHVCIIVNVASECGLTDTNYDQLNTLYAKYAEKEGLRILAFPSNEFNGQEPGTNEDILNFAKHKGSQFDLFSKIEVNGQNAHPLWKYLKHKQGGFVLDLIKWNFTKFLVDKNGQVVERYGPTTSPKDMEDDLKKLFAKTSQYDVKGEL